QLILESWSSFIRRNFPPFEKKDDHRLLMKMQENISEEEQAELEEAFRSGPGSQVKELFDEWWIGLMLLGLWPFLWAVVAAFLRGGLSYRLAGIVLLNADGRPASRWRCAWRVLVVYLPIMLLLLVSLRLDLILVVGLEERSDATLTIISWVSWLC